MKDFSLITVPESANLRQVIEVIDRNSLQIALVTDAEGTKLLGTVTDGDVRRAILKGIAFDQPVTQVMNRKPTTGKIDQSREELVALMRRRNLRHIPLVDGRGNLVGIEVMDLPGSTARKDNWVVVMAGGFGRRLGNLTAEMPKPMLTIKKKPLLGSIIEHLGQAGFCNIFISVNYKRNVIQEHFGDGTSLNLSIRYLEEEAPSGTAGSLSLLEQRPDKPVIVMNADLVTKVNINSLLEFHEREAAHATICIREHEAEIPFGVVRVNENRRVLSIEEKPKTKVFINAGIYVLEPAVLDLIPKNTFIDMTDVLETALQRKMSVAAFPVREDWLDIGRVEDFERANQE